MPLQVHFHKKPSALHLENCAPRKDALPILNCFGKVFFPAVKEAVEEIDVEKGVMIVNAQKFAEVALYED